MTALTSEEAPSSSSADEFEVRAYNTRDLDAVYAIEKTTASSNRSYPKFLFAQFADIFGLGFRVAVKNKDVVGYVVAVPSTTNPHLGYILAVNTLPAQQNAKKQLLADAEQYLRTQAGCTSIVRARPDRAAQESVWSKLTRRLRTVLPSTAPDGYHVRRFRASDLSAVHDVEALAFVDDLYPKTLFRRLSQSHGDGFFVAEHREGRKTTVVGYLLAIVEIPNPDQGWVMSVAVHPDHRDRRVGYRLMAAAEDFLRRHECKDVVLTVDPTNDSAVTLYKHRGYTEVERHDDHHGLKLSRLVMKQQLPLVATPAENVGDTSPVTPLVSSGRKSKWLPSKAPAASKAS